MRFWQEVLLYELNAKFGDTLFGVFFQKSRKMEEGPASGTTKLASSRQIVIHFYFLLFFSGHEPADHKLL